MTKLLRVARKFLFGSVSEGLESESARKILIINLFSTIALLFLLIFSIRNIYLGLAAIGFIGLASLVFIALLFVYLKATKNHEKISHILIILLLLLNTFFLFKGGEENVIFLWFYVFPILSFFLLGIKRGLIYTLILLSISIAILLIPFSFSPVYSLTLKLRFISSFITVALLSFAIEYVRAKSSLILETLRNNIDFLVKERTCELEIAKKNAEESDNLKSSFLTNLSHKIRTPMNAIVGFSNLLLSESIDDNLKKEMVNHIVSNSNILLSLVDDIIDISNIESGKLEIVYHEVNVRNTMANIYNDFMENKTFSNIKLVFDQQESPEISICSDENRISQILRYLLENAFKFTEKGEIHMGYTIENENLIKFYVKDTGIGIPKCLGNKIFDRYITGNTSKHKFFRGAGLGLNICKSLVELLGGNIEYISKTNKGSTFYFTIASKPENKSEILMKLQSKINWENKTILIAEDEESNYKYLKHLLNRTNATILWASNGEEAVNLASKHDIDLILMDIKMPIMNGLEATRVIKGIKKNIPIIAQTAFIYENDEKVSLSSGCDAYIAKPIGKNQLLDLMQHFIKD